MSFTSQSLGAGPNSAATVNTLGYNFAVAVPAGTLVIVALGANVAGLTFTCADNSTQAGSANVYTQVGPVAGAVLTGTVFYCVLTRALLSGDVITITASGNWTRAAGLASSWTPSNNNAQLDKTAVVQNATTSPVVTASSGTLTRSDDMAGCYSFWKGGAVASGHSGAGTIGGGSTASLSGGTTSRIECVSQENGNRGATTAITGGQTYTSITAGAAQLVTFMDPPQYAPPSAASRQIKAYRGSYSSVFSAADEGIPQTGVFASSNSSRPTLFYQGPKSRTVQAFAAAPAAADAYASVSSSPAQPYYAQPNSKVINSADQPAPGVEYAPRADSVPVPFYAGPPSQTIGAFTGPAVALDAWAQTTLGRATPFYAGPRPVTTSVYNPAAAAAADWAPPTLASRIIPFYRAPSSITVSVYDPATNTFRDWAPAVLLSRPVDLYRAPRSSVSNAYASAVAAVGTDWASVSQSRRDSFRYQAPPSVTISVYDVAKNAWVPTIIARPSAWYVAPRSLVVSPLFAPVVVFGTAYASGVVSRRVPFYRGSYSLNVMAADAEIPIPPIPPIPPGPPLPDMAGGGGFGADMGFRFTDRYGDQYVDQYDDRYRETFRIQRQK